MARDWDYEPSLFGSMSHKNNTAWIDGTRSGQAGGFRAMINVMLESSRVLQMLWSGLFRHYTTA